MTIRGLYDNNLYPARFGGAERIYRLYRHLARRAEVVVLSLLRSREFAPASETVEGVRIERRKPLYPTLVHYAERLRLCPMHAAFGLHRALAGRFAWHFRDTAAVYQFDSFLLTALYDRVPRGALKVYHAVNVETDWHRPALKRLFRAGMWERRLREIESHALRGADLVLYVSRQDGDRLVSEFGARRERMLMVPNGFEPERFESPDPARRAELRARLGYEPRHRVAVFTGSAMSHNMEASEFIVKHLAPRCASRTHLKFLLVGNLGGGRSLPPNVRATGEVDDVLPYLWASDVALNPVLSGSGSSLKVPEYLAAGLPVLSTAFGMRGFDDLRGCVTVVERDDMDRHLDPLSPPPPDVRSRLLPYAWETQADRIFRAYEAWFENPGEAPAIWASIA